MSNLKEIRNRIQSVGATRKITSAMKMVSAAKFHKAQETINRYIPYKNTAHRILESISQGGLSKEVLKWFEVPETPQNIAIIVISSSSSLCGAFNLNIGKKVMEDGPHLFSNQWGSNSIHFYTLGKKANDLLEKQNLNIVSNRNDLIDKPNFSATSQFASQLIDDFLKGRFDELYVAFNQFKNPAVQIPTIERILPLKRNESASNSNSDWLFEPNQNEIAEQIIPKIIRIWLHSYILESSAGEHGARMTTMHQATDNATELIDSLTLQYNKARQATITKEIVEIVSGAEALRG